MKINEFKFNVHSQFGEDGIIEKIFEIIKPEFKTCIEFGAWDGVYLSNTANLWKKDWKAILIESDNEKFKELLKNKNDNVIPICAKVDNNLNSLDKILENNNIEKNIDFLSIDIDGNDYYIMESLKFKPKLICIEYNPTIPYWIDLKQDYDAIDSFGCSPKSLYDLAKKMGYMLVSATDVNLFFVDNKYQNLFEKYEQNLSELVCKTHYNYIISKYNGKSIEVTPFVYGNVR